MTKRKPQIFASSSASLTNSVANLLRDQIQSGSYKAGDRLPTERTLAEEHGVGRRTIRNAVNQLVASGLAMRQPRCRPSVGTVNVAIPEARIHKEARVHSMVPSNSSLSLMALLMCQSSQQYEQASNSQQRIFWGMNQALAEAGHHAVFLDLGEVGFEKQNAVREANQLRYLLSHGFGGAVFDSFADCSNRALLKEVAAKIPLVTIDRQIDCTGTDFVSVDNHQAMYDTVTHLATQGHRRIAYVTKNEPIRAVLDRTQGYIAAMRDADLGEMVLSIPSSDAQQDWGTIDAVFQLPEPKRPTAIAAFNDYTAMKLMKRLEILGLSVPRDVALTGFDDVMSILPNGVGLTTVAQPYEEIGRRAAELLLERSKNHLAPARSVELPTRLIVRESSNGWRS